MRTKATEASWRVRFAALEQELIDSHAKVKVMTGELTTLRQRLSRAITAARHLQVTLDGLQHPRPVPNQEP
jgi:hypothetical protein